MPVQQHVLNWLYSVLTSEYHDVNRTYNDVALVLTRYPTLTPRTDVHTFPNGSSALLLHLSGTLPVNFRGTTYRFPLSIWVPHAYPREAPLTYVTPTETMVVRPGQHVDPQGQIYHPYLVGWADFWDKSTLQDFLSVLSDVFAKEPPVVARQQQQQQQPRPVPRSPAPTQAPPPVPPLPPELTTSPSATSRSQSVQSDQRPPPPPPKQHQQPQSPPPPHTHAPSIGSASTPQRPSRYDSAPPLPPQAHASGSQSYRRVQSPPQAHMSPMPHQAQTSMPHQLRQEGPQGTPPSYVQGQWHSQVQPPAWTGAAVQPRPQPPPPPRQDLLDDSLSLDIPASTISAPPIPPNPEKDALLQQLALTLFTIRQRSRQQNESSMAGLRAQRSAMLSAMPALQSEISQLNQLSNAVASNANILHDALRNADAVIEGSRRHTVPDIDELLVAPTVVSNQLYRVVAEERALGDAIFMLGRAVERGRISPAAFAKMTRSLAREWYLKKALAHKIGQGMGLTMPVESIS